MQALLKAADTYSQNKDAVKGLINGGMCSYRVSSR